jgi:hypothetical protein
MRKELSEETRLITNLKDESNKISYDRGKIVNIATQFYKELYKKNNWPNKSNKTVEPHNKEKVPSILRSEVKAII